VHCALVSADPTSSFTIFLATSHRIKRCWQQAVFAGLCSYGPACDVGLKFVVRAHVIRLMENQTCDQYTSHVAVRIVISETLERCEVAALDGFSLCGKRDLTPELLQAAPRAGCFNTLTAFNFAYQGPMACASSILSL